MHFQFPFRSFTIWNPLILVLLTIESQSNCKNFQVIDLLIPMSYGASIIGISLNTWENVQMAMSFIPETSAMTLKLAILAVLFHGKYLPFKNSSLNILLNRLHGQWGSANKTKELYRALRTLSKQNSRDIT